MDHWLELRTAYRLAKLGTISATADDLGVHRATVNRHVDIIESAFGTKVFQRHARGYTLTDAGRDLLDVANRAHEMFSDLEGRSRGKSQHLSGSLLITSLAGLAPLIMPAIQKFRITYPAISLAFSADENIARLEYGEAHVAIRAGSRPQEPDYVVQPFLKLRFGLYAAKSYTERFGLPGPDDLGRHDFVGTIDATSRMPYTAWMNRHVAQDRIALETSDRSVAGAAIEAGLGLGFQSEHNAKENPDLIEVMPPQEDWSADFWIVTHVDLHRTKKIQEFLKFLKSASDL
jgi:DNA-binding transcriptional LysR family regulator